MYVGTEVDKGLCVMTAILYWMRCWTCSQWRDFSSSLARTHSALLTDDPGDVVLSSLQLLDDCNRSAIQQRVAVVDS